MIVERIIIFVLLLWLIFSILYIRYLNREYETMRALYRTSKAMCEEFIQELSLERKRNLYDFSKISTSLRSYQIRHEEITS